VCDGQDGVGLNGGRKEGGREGGRDRREGGMGGLDV